MMFVGRFVRLLTHPFVLVSNWRWENKACGNLLCGHLRKEHFSYAGFCLVGTSTENPCKCLAYMSQKSRK
jgi:hypothetical protein